MPHNYGLLTDVDVSVLERTIDQILTDFVNQPIKVLEIGVYGGATGKGIKEYIESKGRKCVLTGIDNNADGEPMRFGSFYDKVIEANSVDAAYLVENHSQHLIFEDSNHSFAAVVATFFCFKKKVKYDGYFAFHDTSPHIAPCTDFQKVGSKADPDSYISVRKALYEIGLFKELKPTDDEYRMGWRPEKNSPIEYKTKYGFKLIFDEADQNNPAGGVTVFTRKH